MVATAIKIGLGTGVLDRGGSEAEWHRGHIPGAQHAEAGELPRTDFDLPTSAPVAVHCGSEARAAVGLSVLGQRGYTDLALLEGGFSAWREAGHAVVAED